MVNCNMQCKSVIGTCKCTLYKQNLYRHLYNAPSVKLFKLNNHVYARVHIKFTSFVVTKHEQNLSFNCYNPRIS